MIYKGVSIKAPEKTLKHIHLVKPTFPDEIASQLLKSIDILAGIQYDKVCELQYGLHKYMEMKNESPSPQIISAFQQKLEKDNRSRIINYKIKIKSNLINKYLAKSDENSCYNQIKSYVC